MKVSDTPRPNTRASATTRATGPASVQRHTTAAPAKPVIEPTHVMGIPVTELTPKVRNALLTLMQEVESLRRELDQTRAKLNDAEHLADMDPLSPIANRRAFVRELSRVMSYAARYNVDTSLLFFDVDGLKAVNDAHGHAAGDATLVHVAETLRASIRTSDFAGRLGGDEFAVILSHANEEQATQKAEQLQARISAAPVVYEGHSITIGASVGVYTFGPGETPTNVLAAADKKMYSQKEARRAGRNKSA